MPTLTRQTQLARTTTKKLEERIDTHRHNIGIAQGGMDAWTSRLDMINNDSKKIKLYKVYSDPALAEYRDDIVVFALFRPKKNTDTFSKYAKDSYTTNIINEATSFIKKYQNKINRKIRYMNEYVEELRRRSE